MLFDSFSLMCLNVLPVCMKLHHSVPGGPAVQTRASDPLKRVKDGCLPPFGWWGSHLVPLQEQSVRLTTEPSL